MGQNLGPLNIKDTYQGLVQVSGSLLTDGTGSVIDNVTVTASYATKATTADSATTAASATSATSASYAANGGVTKLIAGSRITLSPTDGKGAVTITAAAGAVDTGSFYVSSSVADATITFNQGDGTTESVTVNNVVNATSASYADTANVANSATTANTANEVAVNADATNAARFVSFVDTLSGNDYQRVDNDFTYNPSTNTLSADNFVGNLTGTATTASYVAAANVDGTVATATSASHAVQADNAATADSATSASYATTASYAQNSEADNLTLQQVTDNGRITSNSITASAIYATSTSATNVIAGDLDVKGTITYISSSHLQIGDNLIEINYNKAAGNSGIVTYDTTSPFTASILWDATADRWIAGPWGSEETIILSGDTSSMAVATAVSASHAVNADSAINATSASHAVQADSATTSTTATTAAFASAAATASYVAGANVDGQVASALSSSYALTASVALNAGDPFPYTGTAIISGSLDFSSAQSSSVSLNRNLQQISPPGYPLDNVLIGPRAGLDLTSGTQNVCIGGRLFGLGAGENLTTGNNNIIIGAASGRQITGNSENVLVGTNIGFSNSTYQRTVAIGDAAMRDSANVDYCVAIGKWSGYFMQGFGSVAVGGKSGWQSTGNYNIWMGYDVCGQTATQFTGSNFLGIGSSVTPQDNLLYGSHGSDRFLNINGDLKVSGSVYSDPTALSITSNTASMDCSKRNFFTLTLQNGVDTHLDATNIQAGQTINLKLTNNGTGAGTISFAPEFEFEGGSAFTATAATSAVDVLTFISFDGTSLQATGLNNFS